ncbi:MAG: SMP-30/gluconolactonase/LRE family protein [Pseudomonadales bacterium]|nr:SMP-30/gluconolactonase/LRE family protein [Pseudomonadales bacterium]
MHTHGDSTILRLTGLLLLFSASLVTYILWGSGITSTVTHQFAGQCLPVGGVTAPEDIVIDHLSGTAYISSFGGTNPGIHAVILDGSNPVPIALELDGAGDLLPLGLSLWREPDRPPQLFAVDMRSPRVVIFELTAPTTLKFVRSVRHALIRHPNDVAAAGPDAFYVTNTHASPPGGFSRIAETLLRLELGNVVFFDGTDARIAASDIGYANGVALSRDGNHVFVASTATAEVFRFRRMTNGQLVDDGSVPTPGLADNIDIAPDGLLAVALHPRSLDAMAHMANPARPAPSRIVSLQPDLRAAPEVLYEDDGGEISAASVGARYGDRLLIGAVRAGHFLDCQMGIALPE